MASIPTFKKVLQSYKDWVVANPNTIGNFETLSKWGCYYLAGKLHEPIASELVYSLSNLVVLYNDSLITKHQMQLIHSRVQTHLIPRSLRNKNEVSLKYWMTVLHCTEVLIEMLARNSFGNKGKWTVATIIQIIKCMSNLLLLFRFKNTPVKHPPIFVTRGTGKRVVDDDTLHQEEFRLQRSGRIMHRRDEIGSRTWEELENDQFLRRQEDENKLKLAEIIYIIKPLLHLYTVSAFGSQSWKQWFSALMMDLASLSLYRGRMDLLSYQQHVEISRRKLSLLYYLLRSPMYDKYGKSVIIKLLDTTANKIHLFQFICDRIKRSLPVWQDTYFYMWDS